ncbi:hypothetical protein Golob_027609 [Gossypium lobatum]|uniref:Uncharacterized protein n=1 Tax=Gossypium lobatum TaxID=34289 RepID=A0A7J8NI61_9ROSI|nr:hypothetical protein [Gossypium lobatum]
MHIEEEYYINLYIVGKFERDLYVRCSGGEMVKHNKINLYVEHEIDTAIFADDDLMLLVATVEGAGDGNEGVEIAGSKGGEGVKVAGNEGGKGVEGLDGLDASIEGLEEGDGGLNSDVEEAGKEGVEDESDSDSEDENVYLMDVIYFSDDDDEEEL